MDSPSLSRRDTLKLSVLGAATLALPVAGVVAAKRASEIAENRIPEPFTVPYQAPPVLAPVRTDPATRTSFYEITQRPFRGQILPGVQTTLFGYNGMVPGPTIRARRNEPSVVRQINTLPEQHPTLGYQPWTSTHLHGAPSLPQFDGYASDISLPGQYKDYRYSNSEDARTLWYHDHCVHHTAENVYSGLAGQYHVIDTLEQSLPIPHGDYELPVSIGDAAFRKDGELLFDNRSESGLMGDVILVNGRPWPLLRVEQRKYRLRILNASVARGYRLRLSTGAPMTVIATDGGLVRTPQPVTELLLGVAERYEVIIDFAGLRAGQRVELRNAGVKNAIDYDHTDKVMAFEVTGPATSTVGNEIPAELNPTPKNMHLTAADAVRTRRLRFRRQGGEWTIDQLTWQDVIDSEFRDVRADPALGDIEVWELQNNSGGWNHPIHLHLVDFRILDRNGRPPRAQELGPKDVVYLGENETIRLVTQFGPNEGRYMIHCHNTVHEDHDMMHQFRVGRDLPQNDPITAAPPQNLPASPL
ncbi:multicopper oxidase family protein [Geodermatophilus ruber]|uniref:Multicopper oxidase with three cupredoxin domains (Includes cell division protein FtsP and spore coat protein CotA) n=1 Tax=Geodermatophilus ruber TaxID=504800 RepID=A0A1I4ANW0_9ACTN|nr:multicopper oxidase family protein [Geodermatophilus ruber]SFK57429.1 Multicopper oxidase with three cupredoxin domains (includes cell division protein FtsP and spore coat protein CotA) [Geodermatophilus ruber]